MISNIWQIGGLGSKSINLHTCYLNWYRNRYQKMSKSEKVLQFKYQTVSYVNTKQPQYHLGTWCGVSGPLSSDSGGGVILISPK